MVNLEYLDLHDNLIPSPPPYWLVFFQYHFKSTPELPYLKQIWDLFSSNDENKQNEGKEPAIQYK